MIVLLKIFPNTCDCDKCVPFLHYKAHRITNGKHERWENQVGGCKAMPSCMLQRCIRIGSARCVDNYHKTNRHATENIKEHWKRW